MAKRSMSLLEVNEGKLKKGGGAVWRQGYCAPKPSYRPGVVLVRSNYLLCPDDITSNDSRFNAR